MSTMSKNYNANLIEKNTPLIENQNSISHHPFPYCYNDERSNVIKLPSEAKAYNTPQDTSNWFLKNPPVLKK